MILVTCPCCKGERILRLYEEDLITNTVVLCCHCGSTGTVTAEVEDKTIPNGWLRRMLERWAT